jgi:hypothetical protein
VARKVSAPKSRKKSRAGLARKSPTGRHAPKGGGTSNGRSSTRKATKGKARPAGRSPAQVRRRAEGKQPPHSLARIAATFAKDGPQATRGRRPPPYVRLIEQAASVGVWLVDGSYVRKNIDEEFSNFGHHYSIASIPRDEVWLDIEQVPDEQRFFVHHALIERRLMARGMDYEAARTVAIAEERKMRVRAGDVSQVETDKGLPDATKVHERLWKALENGVHVWIVNGRLVRSCFDIDFTEGGHDYVYEFVPENEVWIDNDLQANERGFVLFHELHERNLMAAGSTYDAAHAEASRLEHHYRNHPTELHVALSNEGWE